MQILRVCIPASGFEQAEAQQVWALLDGKGAVLQRGESSPAQWPAADRLELVLPFERVLLTEVDLPKQSRRQLQRVLPFALEDRLLSPPEQSHCVLGEPQGTLWPVAVVERAWLDGVLNQLRLFGRTPQALWPAWYLLPVGTLLWQGGEGWLRRTQHQSEYLTTIEAELTVLEPAGWDACVAEVDRQAIDLSAGSVAPGEAKSMDPRWRLTLALVAALLLVNWGQLAWQVFGLKKQVAAYKRDINTAFYDVFPLSATVVDPVLQLKRKLQDSASGPAPLADDDFLNLFNRANPALGKTGVPAAVKYADGVLHVDIHAGASAVTAAVADLQAAHLRAEPVAGATPDAPTTLNIRSNEVKP